MGWFQRLFGSGSSAQSPALIPEPEPPPPTLVPRLVPAGVLAGGRGDIAAAEEALRKAGFRFHDAGRDFLCQHHGQCLNVPITGAQAITGVVHFAPELVLRMLSPADFPRLARLMPPTACPIGTTSGHTMYIFMDNLGHSYLLDMEWSLFTELAATPAEMMQVLCEGKNGRVDSVVLDQQGMPTGHWIREGDEHRWWELADFPKIAHYLPPVSLSPGRRPPTWRAMIRSTEKVLAEGAIPSNVMVSCGGFTVRSGQLYFVAHCENSLYVRERAGLTASPTPPGVPPDFHLGAVIPIQAPED